MLGAILGSMISVEAAADNAVTASDGSIDGGDGQLRLQPRVARVAGNAVTNAHRQRIDRSETPHASAVSQGVMLDGQSDQRR